MAHVREKPPLRLHVAVTSPSGRCYRWGEDESEPQNVPSGLRFSDTMPGGFEACDCTLPRKPGVDYSDLERLSTVRVLGAGADVAGEYRLERAPRTSGNEMAISPSAVGHQAALEDDKSAREIYVDRDMNRWTGTSAGRRLALLNAGWEIGEPSVQSDKTSGVPAVVLALPEMANSKAVCDTFYDAGPGLRIAEIYYDFVKSVAVSEFNANFTWKFWSSTSDNGTFDDESGELRAASGAGFVTFTGGPTSLCRVALIEFAFTSALTAAVSREVHMHNLTVYGSHGLTRRGATPGGLYASDVVAHAVGRWAPLLNTTDESIQASSFVIPHLAFLEPTTAGEIVRQATRFGLQDWAVWDNKTFWWHERGARGRRWRARVAPAQLEETGPQVDKLWESVIVQYQDVDGTTSTVGPPGSGAQTESADLKDDDPENPANKLGIVRRDLLQMGTSTAAGATELGRRFLEETKLLDRSGRARLVGHVEDDRGVLHPYWRVRAGDQITFVDSADTSYRRVVKTDKDHPSRTCSVDLDSPPEGLQALLERLGVVLVPLGLN